MSLYTYADGQMARAGFKMNALDWNTVDTEATLGAGDAIELLPQGTPKPVVTWAENMRIPGGAAVRYDRKKVQEHVEGPFTLNAGYRLHQRVAASFFGAETLATLASGAYSHTLTLLSTMGGINATFGYTDNLVAHVVNFWKTEKLAWKWTENTIGSLVCTGIGKKELTDSSGANTLSSLNSNLTFPTQQAVQYQILSAAQTRVRLNKFSSGALGSASDYTSDDVIYPNAISIELARKYKRRHTSRNNPLMDEPVGGDWIGFKGSLTLPVWEYTSLYQNIVAGTPHKLDIRFQGSAIGATGYYDTWTWEFPDITIDSAGLPDLKTVDLLEIVIGFEGHTAASAPTGMAFTQPRLTIQDATNGYHLSNA